MDYHPFKARVNAYLLKYAGGEQRPAYYDIDAVCPALNAVTQGFPQIRRECEALLDRRASMPAYHEVDPGQTKISATIDADKHWRVFMLYMLGYRPEANRALCPETCRILDGIPTLVQAFFSILDPGKNIPLHEGPYLGYLRYHLGLRVPANNPPRILVNGQPHVWQEGKAVMFDDSHPHQVINNSDSLRVVLIIDVERPLPFIPALVNKAVIYGLARPTYFRGVLRRVRKSSFITTS
jgi:aspartyl/asparaginyl beta-hydroxylase (cupin superfamily)